jgi:GH15 family glucan-1,4-alpha-glucosidase
MQNSKSACRENTKPSRFLKKKNSRSISPLAVIETYPKTKQKKKHKENLLERRKQKYTFEPNISDEHDALEQRILKWLEDNNISMVLPDDKEHDYIQNNISNVFQKEKNSFSSVWTSNSNSSSPNQVGSINTSPCLNINNSPLMQKRKENLGGNKGNSVIKLAKSNDSNDYSVIKLEKTNDSNDYGDENEKSEDLEKKTSKSPIEFFKLESHNKP